MAAQWSCGHGAAQGQSWAEGGYTTADALAGCVACMMTKCTGPEKVGALSHQELNLLYKAGLRQNEQPHCLGYLVLKTGCSWPEN